MNEDKQEHLTLNNLGNTLPEINLPKKLLEAAHNHIERL